ncbi:hypothetical protein [Ammoniphilus resinae]|uniref:WD40 repeat domain-containing protein n=1 Tax=Ammoniphilus resinae TaxID=861532 RepID=A0ABS4GU49_9BACL|nr:hypothetical protein [Ammoniphilus resinae]MBP1933797.1 hypothetical protein [Ammoniphilus resinae]
MSGGQKETMDKFKQSSDVERDPTIAKLLVHLKTMREAVPVNYQLKKDLKQKLLAQMQQMGNVNKAQVPVIQNRSKRTRRWVTSIALVTAVIMVSVLWKTMQGPAVEDLKPFPVQGEFVDADLSPDGKQIILLTKESLLVYDTKGQKINSIPLPEQSEVDSVAYSPLGQEAAFILRDQQRSEIWAANLYGGAKRLIYDAENVPIQSLNWSSDGKWLYVQKGEEIWKLSTNSTQAMHIGQGLRPSVSPGGNHIAIEQNGEIVVLSEKEKQVKKIGKGEKAQWINEKWLVFFDSAKQDLVAVNPLEASTKQVPLGLSGKLHGLPGELHSSVDGSQIIMIGHENKNEISVYTGTSRWR